MKHEKISIKWKIFFYLLVFTGILLTVLWLVQICYLDKFYKKIKVEYPQLTDRVALSEAEEDRGLPRALLLREGLLPYAEAVVGGRRLRTAVRRATWLSLAGSAAGVLLTAYLVSLGKFDLLTPLSLTVFLLLWTLPVLLMSDWTGRY